MKMNYFVVGTDDMTGAVRFYDGLFEGLGLTRMQPTDRMTYWMGDDFAFAAAVPFDGQDATNGNGTMVGFSLGSADEVKRLHARAIALGGTSEGEPGPRGPRYSAYIRDPGRNKICLSD